MQGLGPEDDCEFANWSRYRDGGTFVSGYGLLCLYRGEVFPIASGAYLMNEARFDVPNDPACNGERGVQATVLRHAPNSSENGGV